MRLNASRLMTASALGFAFALTSASSAGAQTQAPGCTVTPGPTVRTLDACQKVVDLFRFLAPQVGVALAGGNTVLGEGGALGGPSKASFTVRATVVDGFVPSKDVTIATDGSVVSSNFGAQRAPIPIPTVDVATGLYKGKPVGLTNVGGIDLLISITYVPDVNKGTVAIKSPGSGFALGYGLRVGVIQESAAMPGLSVSYRARKLPTTNIFYTPDNDTLTVTDASIDTKALRVVAGKHYKFLGVAGGFGRDDIDAKSLFKAVLNDPAPVGRVAVTVPGARQKTTRNTAFVNLSLGLPKAQLVGEMGWSSAGKDQDTFNTFDGHKANDKYRYYSLGFTFRP
ncbi:MAG: hypothetical protein ABI852_04525 [Gemmatimonadaceae bacterium]